MMESLIKTVGGALDNLTTSDEERLKAQAALEKVRAEVTHRQADIVKMEMQHGSWIARNWRPTLMMLFVSIIAWNFLLIPVIEWVIQAMDWNIPTPWPVQLPEEMWLLLQIGIGGYLVGRSIEKRR